MKNDEKTLRCAPTRIKLFCETSSHSTVRVKTSDLSAGVSISAIGFDTSKVSVTPNQAETNEKGYVDFRVHCLGLSFCPCETTITFDADKGEYLECEVEVDCTKLPQSLNVESLAILEHHSFLGAPFSSVKMSAGDLHLVGVQTIIAFRKNYKGDYSKMLPALVTELCSLQTVNKAEAAILNRLPEILVPKEMTQALVVANAIRQSLLSIDAGIMALAISSIACDSVMASLQYAVPIGEDILGALVGGAIGSLFGNPFVGAVAGAILLSSAEYNEAR